QAGPVITVKIPKDRDGRPKQFAFVNFKHEESVPYGLQLLNGIKLYGRPMRIQFRSGSSHAAQDVTPSCSQLGAAAAIPPAMLHPASNSSRVPDGVAAVGFPPSLQRQAVVRALVPMAHTHRQHGMELPLLLSPCFLSRLGEVVGIFLWSPERTIPEDLRLLRKGRLGTHPYSPEGRDSRHFGRERFGERGPDYGWAKREEYGHDAEHHYRGGREEPREGWSHDYDYRRESYREAKWHPARH
ncbi:RBM7 protein, partial [Calyptomena viridis]|nr:RBM7 protein [Calyptomena viridis]